jgi:hypothetical protein
MQSKFRVYLRRLKQKKVAHHEGLAGEVEDRLEACEYLLREVHRLTRMLLRAWKHRRAAPTPELGRALGRRKADSAMGLKCHTEAFYYFAARAVSIMKKAPSGVPATPMIKRFSPAGVRDVRNHLLEHPEGSESGVFSRSWQAEGAGGVTLKVARAMGKESVFPDAGLYANAREFITHLSRRLDAAIEQLDQLP